MSRKFKNQLMISLLKLSSPGSPAYGISIGLASQKTLKTNFVFRFSGSTSFWTQTSNRGLLK